MFDWSDEKDRQLRRERHIGFADVVFHIDRGDVLEVADHPHQKKYPHQKILYVRVEDYVYMVPFVESNGRLFLKTIIPSRKLTNRLLRGEK